MAGETGMYVISWGVGNLGISGKVVLHKLVDGSITLASVLLYKRGIAIPINKNFIANKLPFAQKLFQPWDFRT